MVFLWVRYPAHQIMTQEKRGTKIVMPKQNRSMPALFSFPATARIKVTRYSPTRRRIATTAMIRRSPHSEEPLSEVFSVPASGAFSPAGEGFSAG